MISTEWTSHGATAILKFGWVFFLKFVPENAEAYWTPPQVPSLTNLQLHLFISSPGVRKSRALPTCRRAKPVHGSFGLLTLVSHGPQALSYSQNRYLLASILEKDVSSLHQQVEASSKPSSQISTVFAKRSPQDLRSWAAALRKAPRPPYAPGVPISILLPHGEKSNWNGGGDR